MLTDPNKPLVTLINIHLYLLTTDDNQEHSQTLTNIH